MRAVTTSIGRRSLSFCSEKWAGSAQRLHTLSFPRSVVSDIRSMRESASRRTHFEFSGFNSDAPGRRQVLSQTQY